VEERCRREDPALRQHGEGRQVACHLAEPASVAVPPV